MGIVPVYTPMHYSSTSHLKKGTPTTCLSACPTQSCSCHCSRKLPSSCCHVKTAIPLCCQWCQYTLRHTWCHNSGVHCWCHTVWSCLWCQYASQHTWSHKAFWPYESLLSTISSSTMTTRDSTQHDSKHVSCQYTHWLLMGPYKQTCHFWPLGVTGTLT